MKRVLLAVGTLIAVVSLTSGCGVVRTAMSPSVEVCNKYVGEDLKGVEKDFGKADGIKNQTGGRQVRRYSSGYTSATIGVENGKVDSAECNRSQQWGLFF